MKETTPTVYLIAEPQVNTMAMLAYLKDVGGVEWYDRVIGSSDRTGLLNQPSHHLIEFCGRLCYKSWTPGLNANVQKIREDSAGYLLNILTVGHGSVIEHAHFTFVIHNGSRVFTAEMNRHRHPNISEQSLRYVRLDNDLPFRLPHGVLKPETVEMGKQLVEHIEHQIGLMYNLEGIDDEKSFHEKKTITSAIRRFAPMGISTEEVWTANLRDIRHVLEMRTATGAEEEIRLIANQIGQIMIQRAPFFFTDYDIRGSGVPAWTTANKKV